ncbi:hypothetical protein GC173_17060 [bacterium]|nr:hypothetical protein [bacterium]
MPVPNPPVRRLPLVDRQQLLIALVVTICAALLFVTLWKLTPTRSFHADELTNLRMHVLREQGIHAEEQHRYFHGFYAWWMSGDRFDERYARIPAMIAVVLGLFSFSALAGRLGGRWAALAAPFMILVWPRTWDDGQEMRYYGVIFLAATLGMHSLLFIRRGFIYLPLAALAALLWLMSGWHATAAAWHGGALVAGFVLAAMVVWDRLQEWKSLPSEGRPRFPLLGVGVPVALGAGGIVVTLAVVPRILRSVSGRGLDDYLGRLGELNPRLTDLARWYSCWVADGFHPYPALAWILVPTFSLLILAGGVSLWKRHRAILLAMVGLLVFQLAGALLFRLSWVNIAFAHKYLTSSGAMMAMLVVLGSVWVTRWIGERWPRASWLGPTAIALLFVAPLLPRTAVSALGDASHFRQLWTAVMKRSGDDVPVALVVGEAMQSQKVYRYLMPRFVVHEAVAEGFERNPAALGLLARRKPVFVICHPFQIPRFEESGGFVKLEDFPSNFTKVWDFVLMGPPPQTRVAAGSPVDVDRKGEFLFLERGSWQLTGGVATIDGKEVGDGTVVPFEARQLVSISADGARRLIPVLVDGRLRREAAFASDGPLDPFNEPKYRAETRCYFLSNVEQVEYDLHIPADANGLVVEVERDEPRNGSFSVRFGEDLVGFFIDAPRANTPGAGSLWEVVIPIPPSIAGTDQTVRIAYHGENSVRDSDSDKVRVLKLRALRLERLSGNVTAATNQLRFAKLASPPKWAPTGMVDFRTPGSEKFVALANQITGNWDNPQIVQNERGVSIQFPESFPSQIAAFEPFAIEPNRLLAFEIVARGRNLIEKNAAPMISYYKADGAVVRSGQLSQKYITSEDPDWTARLFFEYPPEEASFAVIGLYLNCPKGRGVRVRDDARIDIRSIRFLSSYLDTFDAMLLNQTP